jgi:hypothetical protein
MHGWLGRQMELDTYVIAQSNDGWSLRLGGRPLGLFGDLAHTKRAARVAARMSRRRGRNVEILIYDGEDQATATLIERLTCPSSYGALILACSSLGHGWHLPAALLHLLH